MAALRVNAYAKINLSLEVLNRRPDGFHNLRTVFQTISLADTVTVEASRARRTTVTVTSNVEIPGENLMVRAAHAVLDGLRLRAEVRLGLRKRIPMGGGLGGGSTDAAAVVMALPAVLGRALALEKAFEIAASLGSDVPFFLLGGTALGLGRGTELYPLADVRPAAGLLVAPAVHVSTAHAYGALGRTAEYPAGVGRSSCERVAEAAALGGSWAESVVNDFEAAVFAAHPEIAAVRRKLARTGARPAMMTGSGAAVFGLFESKAERDRALRTFEGDRAFPFSFVSGAKYRSLWLEAGSVQG